MITQRQIKDELTGHQKLLTHLMQNMSDPDAKAQVVIHRLSILVYQYILEKGPSVLAMILEKTGKDLRILMKQIELLQRNESTDKIFH